MPPTTSVINFIAFRPDPPRLREGAVYPTSGNTTTVFTFSVIYRDALNRAPSSAALVIDGTRSVTLTKLVPADSNYADDCVYVARTTLPLGTHKFRFTFGLGSLIMRFPGPTEAEYSSGPVVREYYVMAGTITCGDSQLDGVTVTLTTPTGATRTATTNTNGRYTFTVSLAGDYLVTPARTGYQFDPPQRSVNVGPSTETCNFDSVVLK